MVTGQLETGLAMIDDQTTPKTLRIALIDSDPVDRVVTHHILARRGHQVVSHDNASRLAQYLDAEPVDVLVISGEALDLDQFRTRGANVELVPRVLITNDEIESGAVAAATIILPRPVGSRELLAAVAMASRRRVGIIVHR